MTSAIRSLRSGRIRHWAALLGFGLAVTAAAAVGGLAVRDASTEYATLRQPDWAPPAWVFGPVWTTLYAMIAVAAWLVWRRVGFGPALYAWTVQLLLNAAWTPLFFGAGRYGLAFADLVALGAGAGATAVLFGRQSRTAGLLMAPYLGWITFAGALNFAIWRLNQT